MQEADATSPQILPYQQPVRLKDVALVHFSLRLLKSVERGRDRPPENLNNSCRNTSRHRNLIRVEIKKLLVGQVRINTVSRHTFTPKVVRVLSLYRIVLWKGTLLSQLSPGMG